MDENEEHESHTGAAKNKLSQHINHDEIYSCYNDDENMGWEESEDDDVGTTKVSQGRLLEEEEYCYYGAEPDD